MAAISIYVGNIICEQSWLAIGEESIYVLNGCDGHRSGSVSTYEITIHYCKARLNAGYCTCGQDTFDTKTILYFRPLG